jgi:DNA-binding CsgD family transcriptional regulator
MRHRVDQTRVSGTAEACTPHSQVSVGVCALDLVAMNRDRSEVWFTSPGFQLVSDRLVERFALSGAQARVFVLLVLGYEDAQIATMLFVSRETVRSHTKAILHADGFVNRKDVTRAFLLELARGPSDTP